jgi:hypothetical protein
MKTGLKTRLILGWILTSGFAGLKNGAAASPQENNPVLTIHVARNIEVDATTLSEAERTATGIFKKAGVETQWVNPALPSSDEPARSARTGSFPFSHVQVTLLPSLMANRLGLPYNCRMMHWV